LNSDKFQTGGPHATYVLIISSLLFMVYVMDQQVLAVILEPMKKDLGLSDTMAGLIQTGFSVALGLSTIPAAYLADQWRRSKAISLMAILWSAGSFVTGFAGSFIGVLIPRMFTASAKSGFSPSAIALISESYPEDERASKLGIYNLFLVIGAGIGLLGGGFLSAHAGGWRTPFFVFAIPGIILGVLALFMRDTPQNNCEGEDDCKSGVFESMLKLLSIPTLRWLYFGCGTMSILITSMALWFPALIMRKFEVTEDVAGAVIAITGIFSIPGAIIGGKLADKWQTKSPNGRMKFAALMPAICAASIIITLFLVVIINEGKEFSPNIYLIAGLITFSIYVFCSIAANPAIMASSQGVSPPEMRGMSWSIAVLFINFVGGSIGPGMTGYISDKLSGDAKALAYALIIMALAGFIACFCMWKSSLTYEKDFKAANQVDP
jgi:MFS family permease